MKRGAIFDMDGLMYDTEQLFGISWAEQARAFGFTPNPAFHRAICGTSGTMARDIVRQFYPGIADANAFINNGCDGVAAMLREHVPEKPGLHEIINYLKEQGVKLAVASSSELPLIRSNLEMTGLNDVFDAIVSSSQVRHGKPAPDIFLATANALSVPSEECYVFEDGINGALAGIAAGCATIMIPDLIPPTEELKTHCIGIYPTLNHALSAIKQDLI